MRSAAKLSYEQAQAAIDGKPDDKTGPLLEPILKPLWAAYACAWKGREKRQPLEIDAPEHKIIFKDGKVAGVKRRERFDAHKLIEEFMIQANVCAAETLEQKQRPLIYRIHDRPSDEKIAALTEFLPTVEDELGPRAKPSPPAASTASSQLAQTIAEQGHHQRGGAAHAGAGRLFARQYRPLRPEPARATAHFTSPIRRYADVIIHRALIRALNLGDDGRDRRGRAALDETAQHISETERHSMAAERDATARYIASFLADRVGARIRRPRHRRHPLWPVHPPRRNPSRWPGADPLARRRTIGLMTKPRTRSSATRPASAIPSACASRCAWKKRRRSAAGCSLRVLSRPAAGGSPAGESRAAACKRAATIGTATAAANTAANTSADFCLRWRTPKARATLCVGGGGIMQAHTRTLGFWSCWALAVGTMIGSGVFLLPVALAPYGMLSFGGWLLGGAGAIAIVLCFSRLAARTERDGGPYVYVQEAFGDLAGFLMAWGYWIGFWSAIPVVAIAFAGYLGFFIPALAANAAAQALAALALIGVITLVNIRGLKEMSAFQIGMTMLKIIPLLAIVGAAFVFGTPHNLPPFNPQHAPVLPTLAAVTLITLWPFTGFEAAVTSAASVKDPERTIPRALTAAILMVTVIYLAATLGVMLLMPVDQLAHSQAPFADAARVFGPWGSGFVALGALVATAGTLNGIIFTAGQMPMAVAEDGRAPAWMAKLNKGGAPYLSLLLSAALGAACCCSIIPAVSSARSRSY